MLTDVQFKQNNLMEFFIDECIDLIDMIVLD